MHGNRVNHITIRKNGIQFNLIILLPLNIMEVLGNPDRVIVREHPLSISVPTLADRNAVKITTTTTNGCRCSFYPVGDIDEYIGRYSYEVDDMTLYLEKI